MTDTTTPRPSLAAPGWIPVSERLPESQMHVLGFYLNDYGAKRVIRAFYAKQHQVEDTSDGELEDCDEKDGTYYIREGWYEENEASEYYYRAEGTVTHWMPMPAAPGAAPLSPLATPSDPALISVDFNTHLRPDGDIVRVTIRQGAAELQLTKEQAQSLQQQLASKVQP